MRASAPALEVGLGAADFFLDFFRVPVCLVVNFDRVFCLYLAVQFSCLCLGFDAVEQ